MVVVWTRTVATKRNGKTTVRVFAFADLKARKVTKVPSKGMDDHEVYSVKSASNRSEYNNHLDLAIVVRDVYEPNSLITGGTKLISGQYRRFVIKKEKK